MFYVQQNYCCLIHQYLHLCQFLDSTDILIYMKRKCQETINTADFVLFATNQQIIFCFEQTILHVFLFTKEYSLYKLPVFAINAFNSM